MNKINELEIIKKGEVEITIFWSKPYVDGGVDIIGFKTWCEYLQDWVYVASSTLKGTQYEKLLSLVNDQL